MREFIEQHGQAPTRHEIAVGLGFSSDYASHEHLKTLQRKGLITVIEGQARGIKLNR